jgi:hypothetical protein
MEFDTAHFRLADLPPEESGQTGNKEFDTAHFRLADLGQQQQPQDTPKKRFRVAPAAAAQPVLPQGKLKQASTAAVPGKLPPPVPTPPPMPKAAPRAAPAPPPVPKAAPGKPAPAKPAVPAEQDPEWNPNSTVVDFRTLGHLVHQQDVAQSLFESELAGAPQKATEAHAADLSKWAAGEMVKEEKAAEKGPRPAATPPPKRHLPPPPVPLPVPRASGSAPWVWPSVAIGAILAAALALFLLWD